MTPDLDISLAQFIIQELQKHPWLIYVFFGTAFFINALRLTFPNPRKRPKLVTFIIHLFDPFALNFWGPFQLLSDISNTREARKTKKSKDKNVNKKTTMMNSE